MSIRRFKRVVCAPAIFASLLSQPFPFVSPSIAGQVVAAQAKKPIKIYQISPLSDRLNVLVTLHKSENVKVDYPFSEALVGDATIADVVPLTNQSIYILGKKIGATRLSLLDPKKQVLGTVDIEVSYDLEGLRRHLRDNPALREVKVTSVNGKVLLTGTVPDAVAVQNAMLIATQMAGEDATNALKVAAPQQVMLEVRFIEASRNLNKGIGVNWSASGKVGATTGNENLLPPNGKTAPNGFPIGAMGDTGNGTFFNNTGANLAAGLASNLVPYGSIAGRVLSGALQADVLVNALEEKGLARRLAEPNLVALSGGTANFLAGGEFPFPVVGENNQLSVDFKKFGVSLAFTPTVLANGQINLKIDPEVSELDTTNSVQLGSYNIPSLVVRRASTTIELRDGQSFAMAGLLQGSHISDQRQLPGVGDMPVLGQLFRSSSFQKQETDLVIIVTPRLMRPRVPGQELKTPLDGKTPANDFEFFGLGKQEVKAGDTVAPMTGHILDVDSSAETIRANFSGTK